MADEITGIGETLDDGTVRVRMLYVFPISPRIVDGDGVEVVPAFDAAGIPPYFASQMSQAQLDDFASGDAGWVIRDLKNGHGETDPQFLNRAKLDYDGFTAYTLQQARDKAVEANDFDRRRFQMDR